MIARIALYAFITLLIVMAAARGHDGDYADWFKSLMRPDTGTSCCDLSDGRSTRARMTPEGWEAMTPFGEWVKIPHDKVVRGKGNPTGHAVLFWMPSTGVLCFVEPPLG